MKYAVIGAGLSGLIAARELAQRGGQVVVFEKARGPGGRLSSKRHGDISFDLGAPYFTVRDDDFAMTVADWQAAGWVSVWDFEPQVWRDGRWHQSPDNQRRFVGAPRMSALTRALSHEVEVVSQTRVTGMQQTASGWSLLCGDEAHDGFDGVVISAPPAQAFDLLPAGSALKTVAKARQMSPCWTLMLQAVEPVQEGLAAGFVKHPVLSWLANNNSKPGRTGDGQTWTVHANPDWSQQHAEADREWVMEQMTEAFREVMAAPTFEPADKYVHRWLYSIATRLDPLNDADVLDADAGLVICGDWTMGQRVEGAYLSGRRAARLLLESTGSSAAL